MTRHKRWTVGVTHLVKPPFDPELDAFDGLGALCEALAVRGPGVVGLEGASGDMGCISCSVGIPSPNGSALLRPARRAAPVRRT